MSTCHEAHLLGCPLMSTWHKALSNWTFRTLAFSVDVDYKLTEIIRVTGGALIYISKTILSFQSQSYMIRVP
jgi:hypothetical protein